MSATIFTAYDMALLYNCKLFVKAVKDVLKLDFASILDEAKIVLKDVCYQPSFADKLVVVDEVRYMDGCLSGCNMTSGNCDVYAGYCPELLEMSIQNSDNQQGPDDVFLFSVVVQKDFVNLSLLKDGDFWLSPKGLVYLPLANHKKSDDLPCSAANANIQYNLDVCHSISLYGKMKELVIDSCEQVVQKLNQLYGPDHHFEAGNAFYYENLKCGKFINVDGREESLYFGLSPNVFYESVVVPESAIVPDYFSSVAIISDIFDSKSQSPLIKNGAQFGGNWWYFPICRKLLCCNNYQDLYVARVIEIIKAGLKLS